MSDMRVELKDDEEYCSCCHGYGGYPSDPKIGLTPKSIGRCVLCKGAGKHKKTRYYDNNWRYKYFGEDDESIWENWGRVTNNYRRD